MFHHRAFTTSLLTAGFLSLVAFWWFQGLPITLPEPETPPKLQCVSYAPFEQGQSPAELDQGLVISEARIDQDLALLAQHFSCIRTYSVKGLEAIPRYAAKHHLEWLLGIWVNADPLATEQEITQGIALARRHRDIVKAVIVGNETLLRREITGDQLAAHVRTVKNALPEIPVTYADVWEFWLKNPAISQYTDFVTIHILPYWEDQPVSIEQAIDHVATIRAEVAQRIPGKTLLIGESGWPSAGRMREAALPSLDNQARFMRGFVERATREGWQYNVIEAFDQPWKRSSEGAVGGYWGLFNTQRMDKHLLSGPLNPYPQWPALLGVSLLGWAWSAWLLLTTSGLPLNRRALLGCYGVLGALLLPLQFHQYSVTATSHLEWAWALIASFTALLIFAQTLLNLAQRPGFNALVSERLFSTASALALMATAGLAFDGRYRNFEVYGFGLMAISLALHHPLAPDLLRHGLQKKALGALLSVGALWILVNETPWNHQAVIWVLIMLLLSGLLFRKTRPIALQPLVPAFAGAVTLFALLLAVKWRMIANDELLDLCFREPELLVCQIRSAVGIAMYHQVFAIGAILFTLLAVLIRNVTLCVTAILASLVAMAFWNASVASITLVIATLALIQTHERRIVFAPSPPAS